jgi:hypothetical protein
MSLPFSFLLSSLVYSSLLSKFLCVVVYQLSVISILNQLTLIVNRKNEIFLKILPPLVSGFLTGVVSKFLSGLVSEFLHVPLVSKFLRVCVSVNNTSGFGIFAHVI